MRREIGNLSLRSNQRLWRGVLSGSGRERGRGQFHQARQSEALKNASVVVKRRGPSDPANSFTSLRSRSLTTRPRLSASKEVINLRLASWLLKSDAREHFEGRRCEIKTPARNALLAQIYGQSPIVNLCRHERNHAVDNPQLKADKGQLSVAGKEGGYQLHVAKRRHGPHSARTSCRKNSRSFSRSPSTVKLLPIEKRNCTTALGAISPPFQPLATVGMALGQNSDVTTEAAGVVVMDNSLKKVDEFMHISHRMRSIALQSAVGGMLLSIGGMVFAVTGHLSPVGGAISQEVIDVLAVLNALRAAFPPKVISDL